ncbi:restriction endonuclease subunit S [Planococcus sp. FY231025]|uniref:restriction endonuclease subunit S n=1 Tax=Planococcus sp. FY231025 TaxID=3455699 RepID=UPI003F90F7D1
MKEKKLVPKRRFKEFQNTDAWEQRKYGEVIDLLSGQDFSPSEYNDTCNGIPYMTGASCIVGKETIVNRWTTVPRCLVEKGDLLLVCKGSGYGAIAVMAQDKAHIARQFMALKNLSDLDKVFNFYLLNSIIENIKKEARGLIAGIARDAVIKQEISIPLLAEQAQIGSLLKTFDDIIALHQRKLEKTKALKSAYLAEMFPAEGERVPKRRFAGFSGEWEHRKFDDEIELFSGLTYSPKDVKDKGTLVLRSSNVKNGEIVDADNVYVNSEVVNSSNVRKGDIIVVVRNGSRSLIGKHAQVKSELHHTVIGAFMTGIRSRQSNFVNALLDTKEFKKEIDKNLGATINQITNGMFRNMIFLFPDIQEQKAIGEFFNKLDNQIIKQQQKLNKLKAMKQAYLEEMFV